MEVERYHGMIIKVGGTIVRSLSLPDWSLDYVEFPYGKMPDYRTALQRERVRIAKVTPSRIYFEQ